MSKYFKIDHGFDLKRVDKIKLKKNLVKNISKKSLLNKNPLENYLNIGYYLIIPIIFFLMLGVWLDKVFKSKPFFILIFLFFGFLSSFYNLYRLTKE